MFSQACVKNSVHGGCLPQCMLGYTHSPGQTPPFRHTPPWVDTPLPGRHPPPPHQTVIAADGMHPIGMLSCLIDACDLFFDLFVIIIRFVSVSLPLSLTVKRSLRAIHSEPKRKRNRKFPLMFFVYSLIYFVFASTSRNKAFAPQ